MALRPGQAKGPSVSKDNVGVGTITGSGVVNYIPVWTAAQALGDSTFRYDPISGNIGLHTAPDAGVDLLVANASYANLGVVSAPTDKSATIFANALNGAGPFTSIGIRNYGIAYGGTINGITQNSLALLSTAGKPSALAIIGINDTDTTKIPVYIGQKTTNFDNWIARFTNASMEIKGVVGIGTTPNPYIGLSVSASDTKASISISTPLNTNAASLSIAGDDGSFYNRSYGSIAAGTALGINNANANDITAQYYTLPTCLRIYGDNEEDNVKVPVYIGQRTLNFDDWLARFDNKVCTFKGTLTNITQNASVGGGTVSALWDASQVGKITLFGLGNLYNTTFGPGLGNTFWVQNAYSPSGTNWALPARHVDAGRPSRIMMEDGAIYFAVNNAVGGVVNNPITWVTPLTINGDATITFGSLTASTFVYINAGNKLISLANAAGYLQNDGAGGFSFTTPAFAQHALDSTTAHSLGSLTTAYVPYVLTNKLVNSTISITGGVTSISGTVAFSSLTASTVVYANASRQLVSLANSAGLLTNDGAGNLSWAAAVTPSNLTMTVRNETGVAIAKFRAVCSPGGFNNYPLVSLADPTDSNKNRILGVTTAAINDQANGSIVTCGIVSGVDTSGWAVHAVLYLATNGVITSTFPTVGSVILIGQVMVSDVNGQILLFIKYTSNYLTTATGQDTVIRIGDTAGAKKLIFQNNASTTVGSICSYGCALFGIGTLPAWQSTQRGVLSLFNESGAATLFNMAMGPGVLKAPFIVNNAYNSGTTVWNLTADSATYGKSSKIELNDGTVKLLCSATTGAAAQTITYVTGVNTDTAGNVEIGKTLGISQIGDGTNSIVCQRDPCSIVFWPATQNSFISFRNGDGYMLMSYALNNGSGTFYTLSCSAMGFVGNYGSANGSKMSAMVYGTYNDSDANIVPVYVGQKSTTIDNWSLRLGSDRIFTSKFTLNDNTAQTTINLLRERTDAAFTYSDDMGRITCSLKDNTVDANVFRIQFGAVPAGNTGTFKFQVNTNISGAASWNPVFYYNGTKIYLSCNGLAEIFLMQAAHSKFQADTGGNYDIQLITAAGAYVDFAGPAYVSTSITATGYLPIKIGGAVRKMLVSL